MCLSFPKPPSEGPRAHRRPLGEILDCERLAKVALYPDQGPGEQILVVRGRERLFDELRLPPVTMRRDDHAAGDGVHDVSTKVLPHDVQAQVDRGRRI